MIHESWERFIFFLERLDKNLPDQELQVQIGDAYYNQGYYIERIGKYFERADTAYRKALNLCQKTDLELIRNISIKQALNLSTWSDDAKNKADLLDQALKILTTERIFAGCTREKFPVLYADKEMALGDIYDRRFLLLGQKEYREKAVESYKYAKDIYSKKEEPVKYGKACHGLSLAYNGTGATSTNEEKEQAIQTCEEALAIFTKNDFPVYYAAAQNHLGNVYKAFVDKKNDAKLFKKAILAFQEALEIYKEKKYYFWYGRLQHNMADLHFKYGLNRSLSENVRITYLREAIRFFEEAIEYRKKYPKYYTGTLLNLGRACIKLAEVSAIGDTEKEDVLKKAIQRLDEGIKVCPDDEKRNKGWLYNNKGLALEGLFLLTKRKDYIKEGIEKVKEGIKYTNANSEARSQMEHDLQRMESLGRR
jgi:tetratricopeptide (TPR) repeat protein